MLPSQLVYRTSVSEMAKSAVSMTRSVLSIILPVIQANLSIPGTIEMEVYSHKHTHRPTCMCIHFHTWLSTQVLCLTLMINGHFPSYRPHWFTLLSPQEG